MADPILTPTRVSRYFPGVEETKRFTTLGAQLPPVQAAIERDRLDAQKKALEGNK